MGLPQKPDYLVSSTLVSVPQLSQLCVICSTDGASINGITDLMVVGSPHSGQ
jgi:hypothetical protein